jgi:MoaA/NifB/PqqE/SkfB family radical SAM enzyme
MLPAHNHGWYKKLRVVGEELARYVEIHRSPGGLDLLTLFLTDVCNYRCDHCFYVDALDDADHFMPRFRVERILGSIPTIRYHLVFTGGEVFLHPDIEGILRAAHASGSVNDILVTSNGSLPDKIGEICEESLNWNRKRLSVLIAFDGLEETHDRIRNSKGAFRKAVDTAHRLTRIARDSNGTFQPGFMMVINERNHHEIRELGEFIRREFDSYLAFELIRGASFSVWDLPEEVRAADHQPKGLGLPPTSEWDRIYRDVRDLNRKAGYPLRICTSKLAAQFRMLKHRTPVARCIAQDGLTPVVYPNGDVAACEFSKPFANLADFREDFGWLMASWESRQRRASLNRCFCTHSCNLIPSMQRDLLSNLRLVADL